MPTYILKSVIVRRPGGSYPLDVRVTTAQSFPALQGAAAVFEIGGTADDPLWTLTLTADNGTPFALPVGTPLQVSGQIVGVAAVRDGMMTLTKIGDVR